MLLFLAALLEVRKTSSSSSVSVSRLVSVVTGGEAPCWTPVLLNAARLLPRADFRDFLEMLDFNVFLFELNLEFAGVLEAEVRRLAGWEGGGEVSTLTWLSFSWLEAASSAFSVGEQF